jgi:hypothetical protein
MEDKKVTTALPPPSEVNIRTMRSDLASMRASGGGMPQFRKVAVSGLSLEKGYRTPDESPSQVQPRPSAKPQTTPAARDAAPKEKPAAADGASGGSNFMPILIIILVAILALGAVGYVAYITFTK